MICLCGSKLGKNIGRAWVRASGTGVQPRTQPKAVLGSETQPRMKSYRGSHVGWITYSLLFPPLSISLLYIHLYSHKLQLQKQEIKKTKKKEIHNVSKSTTCQMHTNYAQRKRKITSTLKIDGTVLLHHSSFNHFLSYSSFPPPSYRRFGEAL